MTKKQYTHLIFDADHTLIDYTSDETDALRKLFQEIGLNATEEMLRRVNFLSEQAWTEAGLYDVTSERIKREYHSLYKSHLDVLFERVFREFSFEFSPRKAGEMLLKYLEEGRNRIEGAIETLASLSDKTGGRYRIAIATNGIVSIQEGRLKDFLPYVAELVISERLKTIKPHDDFFKGMLLQLGAEAKDCLMIGDSLTSDIAGALNVGMDCCWFNPKRKKNETGLEPTFEIQKLTDLLEIL